MFSSDLRNINSFIATNGKTINQNYIRKDGPTSDWSWILLDLVTIQYFRVTKTNIEVQNQNKLHAAV